MSFLLLPLPVTPLINILSDARLVGILVDTKTIAAMDTALSLQAFSAIVPPAVNLIYHPTDLFLMNLGGPLPLLTSSSYCSCMSIPIYTSGNTQIYIVVLFSVVFRCFCSFGFMVCSVGTSASTSVGRWWESVSGLGRRMNLLLNYLSYSSLSVRTHDSELTGI